MMNAEQAVLWQKIERFAFDEPHAAYPFSARLAKETGWSRPFADAVIDEYRRFVFLCCVAGHPVCPSEQVDQVWHLHLTYTRNYWQRLCEEVLGRPLHHEPTQGGPAEYRKHVDMYAATFDSYERLFGTPPPSGIWPPAAIRFHEDIQHRRVNTRRFWIVPKRPWLLLTRASSRRAPRMVWAAGALPLVVAIANPLNMQGRDFLALYGALLVTATLLGLAARRLLKQPDNGVSADGLTPYEVACLAHNRAAAVNAAVCALLHEGRIAIMKQEKRSFFGKKSEIYFVPGVLQDEPADPLERVVVQAVDDPAARQTLATIHAAADDAAQAIRDRLQEKGLLESAATAAAARWTPVLIMLAVLLLGLLKVGIGIHRDKSVLFLIVLCVATGIIMAIFSRRPRRSRAGARVLRQLQSAHQRLSQPFDPAPYTANDVALAAGLFGVSTLVAPSMLDMQTAWTDLSRSGTFKGSSGCGGGCGAGCGGGGCGGGCGGCGGD